MKDRLGNVAEGWMTKVVRQTACLNRVWVYRANQICGRTNDLFSLCQGV
jgi:hypothetical protein